MHIQIDHAHHYDWALRHERDVGPDEVARPAPQGEEFRAVRETRQEPRTTVVSLPDSDIERMEADHLAGVESAQRGYEAVHEGGPQHGQTVTVPARVVAPRSRNRLIADHLEGFLFDHSPADQITAIRIVDSSLDPADQAKLERYLNGRFVEEDRPSEPAPAKPARPADKEPQA